MQISLQLVDVAFVGVFLTWGLMDILRRRTGTSEERQSGAAAAAGDGVSSAPAVCSWVTVVCSFAFSLLYICFSLYEYWLFGRFNSKSVSSAVSWILASVTAVYFRKRNLSRGNHWPVVLILWWICSTVLSTVSVSFIIIRLRSKSFHPPPLVRADVVNIVSCALSILLCSTAISTSCSGPRQTDELERPLLPGGSRKDSEGFDSAGVWSRLTFQWLNPLFKTGRVQKLELVDIPLVPQSESAEFASSSLEASLRKQKTGHSSLPKAISFAVWRSMTINGAIAGKHLLSHQFSPFSLSFLWRVSYRTHSLVLFFCFFCIRNQHYGFVHWPISDHTLREFLI